MRSASLAAVAAVSAAATPAPFSISSTFGSHMVLEPPVTLWGHGTPGDVVITTVKLPHSALSNSTTVDASGLWRQPLELVEGLDPITITATHGGESLNITDVLVGKVILCSGQSNIQLVTVSKAFNATNEVAACGSFPLVRLGQVTSGASATPTVDMDIQWAPASSASCPDFSATCWFTARDLFDELGGSVAVGVVESAVGGTAVRNWVPTEGLASCSQPWAGLQHYGWHPYTHSTLYNGMINALGTGPTSFSFVLWDQAESDSYPQTMAGYYSCQTLAHINSWRKLLQSPTLPWIFIHLQPYTGSVSTKDPLFLECEGLNGDSLAELRHEQLTALQLHNTGYASAIDLGDPTSPYGNVHFQNKQVISARAVTAALAVAFGKAPLGGGGLYDKGPLAKAAMAYPPPQFLSQVPTSTTGCAMKVLFTPGGGDGGLVNGATADPGSSGTSAVCPPEVGTGNCSGYQLLCATPEIPHNPANPAAWHPAEAELGTEGGAMYLTLTVKGAPTGTVARGSRYAWSAWPLTTLFGKAAGGGAGLPVLPWNQALTCTGGALPGSPC
eukprot:m.17253 g.17253  ORF g.17253 m.17253 type:complete len:558 (+) comp5161_c0_seq1:35-1708(+)